MRVLLFCCLSFCFIGGCVYQGPSIGVSAGYKGVAVGVTLYGQNPVAAVAQSNAAEAVATAQSAPTTVIVPASETASSARTK